MSKTRYANFSGIRKNNSFSTVLSFTGLKDYSRQICHSLYGSQYNNV